MSALVIKKAERIQRKFKGALNGPSGSGKTLTMLYLLRGLVGPTGRILVIDSERGSASLYSDKVDFDVIELPNTHYQTYLDAIKAGVEGNFDAIGIDSTSPAWEDLLEEVDKITARSKSRNSFEAWGEVTPIYKKLVQAIVAAPCHVISTFRSKTDYVMEEYTRADGRKGSRPVKVGLAPIFRQGGEYEFDLVANIDLEHNFMVEKTRLEFLDGMVEKKVGIPLGLEIAKWLNSGKKEEPIVPDANPLDYKIETQGSRYFGKTLNEILHIDANWINTAKSDPRVMAKLSKRDNANLAAISVEFSVEARPVTSVNPLTLPIQDELPDSFNN